MMNKSQPPKEQGSIQVGRSKDGLIAVGKDNELVFIMKPADAMLLCAELLKHASIIIAGASMVDEAIERAENNGDDKTIKLPESRQCNVDDCGCEE